MKQFGLFISLGTLGLTACTTVVHQPYTPVPSPTSQPTHPQPTPQPQITPTISPTPINTQSTPSPSRYQPINNYAQCLTNLRPQALAKGIYPSTFDRYTQSLQPDYSVIDRLNYQPEFSTPIWDYMAGLVDEERIIMGKQALQKHRTALNQIQQQYGVPAALVVAVWGVETNYGNISGKYPLLQALSTLSCEGRRQNYFKGEFFATLNILQQGDLTESQLKGSWAGAFGHTQFMPSTYQRLAVDFDKDGRRDIISSETDALASTANFFKRAGWQTNQPWGFEVKLPSHVSIQGEDRKNKKTLQHWSNRGITRIDGSPLILGHLQANQVAGIFAPAGRNGPIFLVFKNFDVIFSYNNAASYALSIAHLSDRLQGANALQTAWPTDDTGTSRAERRLIQQLLLERGYDIGEVDGLIGDKTRRAIQQEQRRLGLEPTGRAGQKILRALQQRY